MELPTNKDLVRFVSKIDTTGVCWEWRGTRLAAGYGVFKLKGVPSLAHRMAFELFKEPIPAGLQIDHACHNVSCVRPDHLRAVTPKQNSENRHGATSRSKTGIRGVSWSKDVRKWQAIICHKGKRYHLGYFTDIKDAETAAISKRNLLFTHNEMDRN